VDCGVVGGPSSALAWILREYAGVWFRNKYLYYGAKFIAGWLTFPLKYLDYFLSHRTHAHIIASGLYFLGRKPAQVDELPACSDGGTGKRVIEFVGRK